MQSLSFETRNESQTYSQLEQVFNKGDLCHWITIGF